MTICDDCQRAESELWPIYRDAWCCRARMLMSLVGASGAGLTKADVQRTAAMAYKRAFPDEWPMLRERLNELIARAA